MSLELMFIVHADLILNHIMHCIYFSIRNLNW